MRDDPGDRRETITIRFPPASGPGSGKEAWRRLVRELLDANDSLSRIIDGQSVIVRELKAEIAMLRDQIAKRRPPGGRVPLPDDKVARIEREIARGGSLRGIAKTFGVSHQTVARIKNRMEKRVSPERGRALSH